MIAKCILEPVKKKLTTKQLKKSSYETITAFWKWTLLGTIQRPSDYESDALTNWAKGPCGKLQSPSAALEVCEIRKIRAGKHTSLNIFYLPVPNWAVVQLLMLILSWRLSQRSRFDQWKCQHIKSYEKSMEDGALLSVWILLFTPLTPAANRGNTCTNHPG